MADNPSAAKPSALDSVEARMYGYLLPSYIPKAGSHPVLKQAKVVHDIHEPLEGEFPKEEAPKVTFHNARKLQARTTIKEMFENRGFCLLDAPTNVKTWNTSYFKMFNNDIRNYYRDEVLTLVKEQLFPEYHIEDNDALPMVMRRGPGTDLQFAMGVHQDYAMNMDDYMEATNFWDPSGYAVQGIQAKWDKPEVQGFVVVNFWRPAVTGESDYAAWDEHFQVHGLRDHPLGVVDASTVAQEDLVWDGFTGNGKESNQMKLRYNPNQTWYYYPEMTKDEVLVFKQFEYWKHDGDTPPFKTNFHSSFDDPTTPDDAPKRQSAEYRVPVYIGRRKTDEEMAAVEPEPSTPDNGSCALM